MITTRIRFTYPPLIQHPHTARRLPLNILAAALIVFGLACGVQAQPVISSQAGYTITWDGNDGEYSGLSVPNNAAKASNGSQAFGSGQLIADGTAGQHMTNVNNGTYGNGSSWINGTFDVPSPLDTASPAGGATSFIGIRFTNTIAISSIAWGRDNTTGGASDRWQTVYTLQVTTVANPDGGTTTTGNAATGWVTIGTVTTGNAQTNATFRAWLRHRYNVAQGGNPIPATGMRIVCAWNAAAIDEIEVNAPVPKTWTGNGGANLWDINTSANWLDAGGSTAGGSTYVSYVFFDNDVVTFGDNGGTNLVVNINSTVSPASTTVNATTNYTFTGTGGIGGTNSLIKLGAGTLTLSTVNTYTGSTTLSNGTLSVASIANGGVNSGLGSSANAAANLVFAGGTLSYSGTTNTSSDRNFTINNATIGIVNVANAAAKLTLTGTTPTTNGTLRVTGPGTLTLDSGTSTTLNGLIIASGTNELKSGTLILRNVGASVGTTNGFVNAGHFLLTGGSVISTNSAGFILFPAGRYDITGAGNSFVQNGGVFDGGNSAVYNAYNTSGSTYINSGIFNCGRFSLTYGTTGILNLNGGICSVNYIDAQSSGAPQVNFNGGTLLAKQATTQFIGLANGGTNIPAVYIQSGGAFIDSSNNAVTIPVALKTDATSLGGGLTKLGTGTLNLSGANTYSGNTFISAGTLALSVGGLITNTASITVASNAIFDVSGLTGGSLPFTLGIPLTTQTLSNSAPGAIINGTNNCSAGTISLVYDGVNPSFTITNGGMTLSASTTFKVNKTGAALPLGVYKLIAKATAGNVGLVGGTVPAVTVNNGLSQATLGIVGGELYLTNGGPSTISYGSTSFTYNGSAQTPTITFSGSTGLETTNYVGTGATTYSDVNAPTNAGTYYVSNTVAADASYFGAINSANFTISAKAASVTADTKTKTYGSVNPVLTAVTNGAVTGDVINVTLATDATQYSAVGVSNITVTADSNPNYTVLTTNSTLTINPASTFVGASSTNNPSGYKDSVAFLATLPTDATGSVVFSSTNGPLSTNTLSSGSVTSLSITNLARGTNVITVAYLGDGNYIGSTNTLDQVVTNHPPVAVDATYYRAKGLSLKIEITNLLSNVTDADGDTNTLQSVGAGLTNATIMTDSTCVYYLPGTGTGSNDNDVVSYTVSDGFGGTATANILVNVFSAAGPAQMSLPTNGVVNITFFGIPNYTYVVQTTTNLSVPWWTLSTNTAGTNGIWQFTDPNATNAQQYYRSSQP